MSEAPASPWLTAKDGAAYARCGVKVIYRAIDDGHLRAARINNRRDIRLRAEWIDAFLESTATPVELTDNEKARALRSTVAPAQNDRQIRLAASAKSTG